MPPPPTAHWPQPTTALSPFRPQKKEGKKERERFACPFRQRRRPSACRLVSGPLFLSPRRPDPAETARHGAALVPAGPRVVSRGKPRSKEASRGRKDGGEAIQHGPLHSPPAARLSSLGKSAALRRLPPPCAAHSARAAAQRVRSAAARAPLQEFPPRASWGQWWPPDKARPLPPIRRAPAAFRLQLPSAPLHSTLLALSTAFEFYTPTPTQPLPWMMMLLVSRERNAPLSAVH